MFIDKVFYGRSSGMTYLMPSKCSSLNTACRKKIYHKGKTAVSYFCDDSCFGIWFVRAINFPRCNDREIVESYIDFKHYGNINNLMCFNVFVLYDKAFCD